jgi:signal peptidase I
VITYLIATGVPAVVAGLALLLVRRRLAIITISGVSMSPTYAPGDRVLVRRISMRQLQVGQVVVFEQPADEAQKSRPRQVRGLRRQHWMIKRIAAMPGDNWTHPEGGPSAPGRGTAGQRLQVPPGQIAVLGDNRRISHDSRQLGFIPGDQILGIVVRSINHQCSAPAHARGSAWRSGRSQDLGSCSPPG